MWINVESLRVRSNNPAQTINDHITSDTVKVSYYIRYSDRILIVREIENSIVDKSYYPLESVDTVEVLNEKDGIDNGN